MLTSPAVRGSAAAAREAGISAYLTKPIRQSQLFDAIAAVMDITHNGDAPLVTRHWLAETRMGHLPRLLVAEDNTVNQKVAAAMLTKLGYADDRVVGAVDDDLRGGGQLRDPVVGPAPPPQRVVDISGDSYRMRAHRAGRRPGVARGHPSTPTLESLVVWPVDER